MSETSFNVTITGPALEMLPRLKDKPGVGVAIARAMDKQNQLTVAHIQKTYLSFAGAGPTVPTGLRVKSNRLRGSLRASKAVNTGAGVVSAIGTNVVYAAIHEFGGEIPAHDIVARNGRALRFVIGGRVIFRHRVHFPGATLPARAPIQRGIRDCLPQYTTAISGAIGSFYGTGGAA